MSIEEIIEISVAAREMRIDSCYIGRMAGHHVGVVLAILPKVYRGLIIAGHAYRASRNYFAVVFIWRPKCACLWPIVSKANMTCDPWRPGE